MKFVEVKGRLIYYKLGMFLMFVVFRWEEFRLILVIIDVFMYIGIVFGNLWGFWLLIYNFNEF